MNDGEPFFTLKCVSLQSISAMQLKHGVNIYQTDEFGPVREKDCDDCDPEIGFTFQHYIISQSV